MQALHDSLPRVLFVTAHAFNHSTGGGVTFSNLFAGWPREALATVHCDTVPVTTDVCRRYYALTPRELRKWGPLHYLAGAVGQAGDVGASDSKGGPARFRQALRGLKRRIIGDCTPEQARLSPELEDWIVEFRPQVLYTILGTNGLMELVERIRRRFALPLVVHFMDDWPSVLYRGGLISPLERWRMWRNLRRLVGVARVRMGISQAMCTAYGRIFGVPFQPVHNGVDSQALSRFARTDLAVGGELRISYAGSIYPFAQLDSLAACCEAAAALSRAGRRLRFIITCPAAQLDLYRHRLAIDTCIELRPAAVEWQDYYRALCRADILVLPVNFDADSGAFIRYSMPTKVPEYLASGVPLLAYGPAGVAQIDEARRDGWAEVVDAQDPPLLQAAIASLADNMALRRRCVSAAQASAAGRYDLDALRAAFRASIASTQTQGRHQ